MADLLQRYQLLHGESEAARAELARIKGAGKEVVVVSACLVGIACRHDGGHRKNETALAELGDVEVLPLCPEVLARFGVPRLTITLSTDGKSAIDARGRDVTTELEAGVRLADLFADLGGAKRALLKERSPSCGVHKVHGPDGIRDGKGRFAARLGKRGLPIVSEETKNC